MGKAYEQAGVNLEAGYEAVARMQKHTASTHRPEVLGQLGQFAGLFDLSSYAGEEPVLVSGTDGVGTKLMLAFETGVHHTIGIDVVAMCVNDIAAQGAAPLFFLDYVACGELQPEKMERIVAGVAQGCKQAGAALIGGETAEMPGMYENEAYDIAGFAVGVVEKSRLVTGESCKSGDRLIGLASSGLHSNGFSLVRKLVREGGFDLQKSYGFAQTLGEELLQSTRIYVPSILSLTEKHDIGGMAHITGGGLIENVPRMLPDGLGAVIDNTAWPTLPILDWLRSVGGLSCEDMRATFNMGIGMVLVVASEEVASALADLQKNGEEAYEIGYIQKGEGVSFHENAVSFSGGDRR